MLIEMGEDTEKVANTRFNPFVFIYFGDVIKYYCVVYFCVKLLYFLSIS